MTGHPPCSVEDHPLLRGLGGEHVEQIVASGEIERYADDETIVVEGSLGDAIFLVLEGEVAVSRAGRMLARVHAGEFFGEMSLVEPAPRSASVSAVRETYLLRLPHAAMHRLAERDPRAMNAVLAAVVRSLSARLRAMNEMVCDVARLSDYLRASFI